ncbi:MAG: BrnT family toxin [Chloroflexaceae bacterium]|nr:BrnT family toxin [Chloroflexaceae bacterium]
MEFDWDEEKRRTNLIKHGIDFMTATQIFWGRFREVPAKTSLEGQEARYVGFGYVNSVAVAVVYVKVGKSIRIISARRASRRERKKYY